MACAIEGDEALLLFARGQLDPAARGQLEPHLDACQRCRRLVAFAVRPAGPAAGDRLGRYVLEARLGAGASGEVWQAYDPELERKVAIKRLPGGQLDRLRAEARSAASLQHPGLVSIHELGEDRAGPFLVMELVRGEPLDRHCARHRPSLRAIEGLLEQACAALAALHARGVVHGDLKPANILVDDQGQLKLVDFGLAQRALVPAPHGGTPIYMAPEQLAQPPAPASAASDQYALCLAFVAAVAGVRPFASARTLADLARLKAQPPGELERLPGALARRLRRGLAPRPEDRYPSLARLTASPRRAPRLALATALLAALALAGFVRGEPTRPLGLPMALIMAKQRLLLPAAPGRHWELLSDLVRQRLDSQLEAITMALPMSAGDPRRRDCVEARARELEATARAIAEQRLDDTALMASATFSSVEPCLRAAVPRPAPPLGELRQGLVTARLQFEDGELAAARRWVESAHDEQLAQVSPELASEISRLGAITASFAGDPRAADALIHRSLVEAEQAGASHQRARALLTWCQIDAQREDWSALDEHLRLASAVLGERPPPELASMVATLRCTRAAGPGDRALILAACPLAVIAAAAEGDAGRLAWRLSQLAQLLGDESLLHQAEQLLARATSPAHPAAIETRLVRAMLSHSEDELRAALRQGGAYPMADVSLRALFILAQLELTVHGWPLIAIYRLTPAILLAGFRQGVDAPGRAELAALRARALLVIAEASHDPGLQHAGTMELEAALAALARTRPEAPRDQDYALFLGYAYLDDGQLAAASRVAASLEHVVPDSDTVALGREDLLAMVRAREGRPDEAARWAEQFLAHAKGRGLTASDTFDSQLVILEAAWPRRRPWVRQQVVSLRLALRKLGARSELAELEAWQRRHP